MHNQDFGGKMTISVARTKFIVNMIFQNGIFPFLWDNSSRSTYKVFASNEKHLLCHFTLPNWGLSKYDDTLDFYQHIDLQEMKSYALTLQKPHNIITFYLSGM